MFNERVAPVPANGMKRLRCLCMIDQMPGNRQPRLRGLGTTAVNDNKSAPLFLDTLLEWSERILVAQSLDEVLH